MARVLTIGTPTASTLLLLPDRGMPIFAGFSLPRLPDEPDTATLAALLDRPHRTNGMDEHQPTAVLLPTGGMGNFQ